MLAVRVEIPFTFEEWAFAGICGLRAAAVLTAYKLQESFRTNDKALIGRAAQSPCHKAHSNAVCVSTNSVMCLGELSRHQHA
jgi:hypothetical protein